MKNVQLRPFIQKLVHLEPAPEPVLSCFVDLDQPRLGTLAELEGRARLLRHALPPRLRSDFTDAFDEIRSYLTGSLRPESRSVALFSRWGDQPLFLDRQFEVPMETRLSLESRPEIYPLVELKDVYHRFVIVITTETEARILETTLGSVTEEVLKERPELRKRFGREWTREHYHNHKREREEQFIREKIRIIDELMGRRGHNHLVIAGSPKMVARLTKALPRRLRDKVISTVASNPGDGLSPIMREAIHLFVAAENLESHHRVEELKAALYRDGLATIGYYACREALGGGYADLLLVDQDHTEVEQREDLVRLATEMGVGVETVNRNEVLEQLGGFGCLLRYLPRGYPGEKVPLLAA